MTVYTPILFYRSEPKSINH